MYHIPYHSIAVALKHMPLGQFSDSDVLSTFEFLPKDTRDKSTPTRNVKTESDSVGHLGLNANISSQMPRSHTDLSKMLSEELRMNVISSVPCYCDIQFVRKEFLTALQFPEHPFAIKIQELINNMERLAQR